MKRAGCITFIVGLIVLVILLAAAYSFAIRPWHLRWGTTVAELAMTLPGDELVDSPERSVTRAITIEAPAEQVWRWVAQSGADQGGLYSYTALESLVACPIVNAGSIHPEWQNPQPGDTWAMCPGGSGPPPYTVAAVEPGKALILGHPENGGWFDTWAFVVQPVDADTTRLIHRSRTAVDLGWVKAIELPMFIMERGMMRGIRARAEGWPVDPSAEDPYRVMFGVLLAGYLLTRLVYQRRSTRPVARAGGAGLQVLLMTLVMIATIPGIVYVMGESLDGFHYNLPGWLRVAGAMVFLAGDLLFIATHRALGKNWSGLVEIQSGHRLVREGPYRFVRHPMYSALFLIGIGMTLLPANALVGWPYLAALAALYFSRVNAEEALLRKQFGGEYEAYMLQTGRLLPRVGGKRAEKANVL